MKKMIALVLLICLMVPLCSCAAVQDAATDALAAAQKELESQVQKVLNEYKVEMVEVKTVFGKLNDEGSKMQLFCTTLIKAENETMAKACADALKGAFDEAGIQRQTGSKVENALLIHKEIVFKHSDFSDGTYYVIYGYKKDMGIDLPELTLPKL